MLDMEEIVQVSLSSQSASTAIVGTQRVSFLLNNPVQIPLESHATVGLSNMSIPRAWYNVTATTNDIVVNSVLYSITPGNYSATSLATALTTALSPLSVTVTYNVTLLGFTFACASPITITFAGTSMARQLGISQTLGPALQLVSDVAIDLAGTRSIHVVIDNMNSTLRESYLAGSYSSTLDVVPVTVQAGSIVNYISQVIKWIPIRVGASISEIIVSIVDDNGDLLDLRGAHYELTIAFRIKRFSASPDRMMQPIDAPSMTLGDIVETGHMR